MARTPIYLNTRTFTSHLCEPSPLRPSCDHLFPFPFLTTLQSSVLTYSSPSSLLSLGLVAYLLFLDYGSTPASHDIDPMKQRWCSSRMSGRNTKYVYTERNTLTRQTLFIIICCVTSGFYITSLLAERWLRHVDRLPMDLRSREKTFGGFPNASPC